MSGVHVCIIWHLGYVIGWWWKVKLGQWGKKQCDVSWDIGVFMHAFPIYVLVSYCFFFLHGCCSFFNSLEWFPFMHSVCIHQEPASDSQHYYGTSFFWLFPPRSLNTFVLKGASVFSRFILSHWVVNVVLFPVIWQWTEATYGRQLSKLHQLNHNTGLDQPVIALPLEMILNLKSPESRWKIKSLF